MSLRLAALAGILFIAFGVDAARADPSIENGDVIDVIMDQARLATVPRGTKSIVIGNPAIADVAPLKGGNSLIVTGRSYGETNMLIVDEKGAVLVEKTLRVHPSDRVLVVQRGDSRTSYSCRPRCMPSVQLGDDKTFMGEAIGAIQSRNGFAGGAAPH